MTQLGIVTYNIAKDWDLPTILSRLEKLGYAGVELRTGHAHKVEVNLTGARATRSASGSRIPRCILPGWVAHSSISRPIPRSFARTSRGRRSTSAWHTTSARRA